jgi:hypothetical protein
MSLVKPSRNTIAETAARLREKKNTLLDIRALSLLFKAHRYNTDVAEVLLKVVALNDLYSTRIFKVRDAARTIVAAKIDSLLRTGDPRAVERIQTMRLGGRKRSTYSFATKYCSWHAPDKYPIFDRNVKAALTAYRKRDKFETFTQNDLLDYQTFLRVLLAFRERYGLQDVSNGDLDKFLWKIGTKPRKIRDRNA